MPTPKRKRGAYRKDPKVPGGSWKAAMRVLLILNWGRPTSWLRRVEGSEGIYAVVTSWRRLARAAAFGQPNRMRLLLEWLETMGYVGRIDRRDERRWLIKLKPAEPTHPAALSETES